MPSEATLSLVLRSSVGGRKRRALRGYLSSALLRPWRFFQPPSDSPPVSSSPSSFSSRVLVARELEVEASTASRDFFGERLFVPTAAGFYDDPGCVESFGATVAVRAYHCHRNLIPSSSSSSSPETKTEMETRELLDEAIFENAALEFGGAFAAAGNMAMAGRASPTR